jgi:molecular chaperone DnaK
VLFEGDQAIVGKEALKAISTEAEHVAQCAKRELGERAFHKVIDGRRFPPEALEAFILNKVRLDAIRHIGDFRKVVITVPAYFDEVRRKATQDAGHMAGFEVLDIINEPTAAAIAHGVLKGFLNRDGQANQPRKLLVYDLGGGTFDVSVLQLQQNVFEALATGGDTFLGGVDFDNRIIDWALDQFWRKHRVDLAQSPIALQRVKGAAEAAKIDLSLIPNTAIDLPFVEERRGKPLDLRMAISRQQLDELTSDLVDRTFQLCDEVLEQKGLTRGDIDEVILVGGQSRMPLVQQRILEHFGKPPRKGVHPDECVALGAALLGDSLDSIDSVTLVDVLSMPIGIAAPNDRMRKVLEKNQPIPATRSFRLPPPREPGKPIEIDIYQGDSDQIVDDEFLGSLRLPAAATGRRIDFRLDEECLLRVSFDDPERGMVEVPFATRDTPEALRRAIAEKTPPPGAAGAAQREQRRGLFGWLKRG